MVRSTEGEDDRVSTQHLLASAPIRPHSLSLVGPERTEPLHDFPVTSHEVGNRCPEAALLRLARPALDTPAGTVQPWKPCRTQRHESEPAKVHDEGAGMPETGGGPSVERKQSEWRAMPAGQGWLVV